MKHYGDVRAELEKGAYSISVPFIEDVTAVIRVNATFERGVLKAIDSVTKERLNQIFFLGSGCKA